MIGDLWGLFVTGPITNGLVFFSAILGGNFGLAIILFTLVTRVILYPLTVKQLRSTRAMQQLQPRIKELQERHKNDRARLQREQMRLFKEAGVNPLGCLGPIMIQMPIWIGLFYAIRSSVADTPEGLVSLSNKLYSWLPLVDEVIPLNSSFLWMDLGRPDPSPLIMPLLVGASMWVVQKMSTIPSADPRQQSTTNMMTWMFPIMFGFWTLTFPSGLAVYWVTSNVVSIVLQYRVTGWGGLKKQPAPAPAGLDDQTGAKAEPVPNTAAAPTSPIGNFLKRVFLGNPPVAVPPGESREAQLPQATPDGETATGERSAGERETHGTARDDRQDGRRGYRQGAQGARGRARRRRGRRRR